MLLVIPTRMASSTRVARRDDVMVAPSLCLGCELDRHKINGECRTNRAFASRTPRRAGFLGGCGLAACGSCLPGACKGAPGHEALQWPANNFAYPCPGATHDTPQAIMPAGQSELIAPRSWKRSCEGVARKLCPVIFRSKSN